jgi:hypothetical protein
VTATSRLRVGSGICLVVERIWSWPKPAQRPHPPVHWLPSAPRGPVERALDRYEAAVAELYGE